MGSNFELTFSMDDEPYLMEDAEGGGDPRSVWMKMHGRYQSHTSKADNAAKRNATEEEMEHRRNAAFERKQGNEWRNKHGLTGKAPWDHDDDDKPAAEAPKADEPAKAAETPKPAAPAQNSGASPQQRATDFKAAVPQPPKPAQPQQQQPQKPKPNPEQERKDEEARKAKDLSNARIPREKYQDQRPLRVRALEKYGKKVEAAKKDIPWYKSGKSALTAKAKANVAKRLNKDEKRPGFGYKDQIKNKEEAIRNHEKEAVESKKAQKDHEKQAGEHASDRVKFEKKRDRSWFSWSKKKFDRQAKASKSAAHDEENQASAAWNKRVQANRNRDSTSHEYRKLHGQRGEYKDKAKQLHLAHLIRTGQPLNEAQEAYVLADPKLKAALFLARHGR